VNPLQGIAAFLGDTVPVTYTANDDGTASVTIEADTDGNLATTPDRVVLFGPVNDPNGAQAPALLSIQGVPTGVVHGLVLVADDGVNPEVEVALPRGLLVSVAMAGVAPPRSNRYGFLQAELIFTRGEAEDNAVVQNGDGFADDGVLVRWNVDTGVAVFTPKSADVSNVGNGQAQPLGIQGSLMATLTLEADENGSLNAGNTLTAGDMDLTDSMITYSRPGPGAGVVTNTLAGTVQIVGMLSDRIVAAFNEAGEGAAGTGVNGDADAADTVFGYIDPTLPVGPFESNHWAFWPLASVPGSTAFRMDTAAIAAFLVDETADGMTNHNAASGDVDVLDKFLQVGDLLTPGPGPATLLTMVTDAAAVPLPVDPLGGFDVSASNLVACYADEVAGGVDVDANALVGGQVPCVFDVTSATLYALSDPGGAGFLNAGAGAPVMILDGTVCLHTAMEGGRVEGTVGTNNDGDGGADAQLLYWCDVSVAPVATQPLAVALPGIGLTALALDGGSATEVAPGWVVLVVNEGANGNADINGNSQIDSALLIVDMHTIDPGTGSPTVHNPGIAPSAAGNIPLSGVYGEFPAAADHGIVVRLLEIQNGILNGDGDNVDTLLAYVSFNAPGGFTVLGVGADQVVVSGGLIGATVNETFTATDVAGNGGTTDFALVILEKTGIQRAVRLCAQQSLPASADGVVWAYLRTEVGESRDLNGDTDQVDLIMGLLVL